MWYDSKHIEIKTAKDWYNTISNEYKKYHNHLDSFDKWFFLRVLPRNLENLNIIDLWAWDWRIWKFFKDKPIQKYTACDISEKILKKHPSTNKIEKIVCDLEEKLQFQNEAYDLALSFFLLEHIENLNLLFQEVYRILKPWWQRIIWYFLQRREFVWKKNKETFKIKLFKYRIQDIEKEAKENFFDIEIFPINEKSIIWYIISLRK